MKRLIYILILSIAVLFVNGQGVHFSQFYASPLLINPALAGYSKCNLRAGVSYKNQWGSFSNPYVTQSCFIDGKYMPNKGSNEWFGTGISFYDDNAGDGSLGTTNSMVYGSLYKGLSSDNKFFGALGVGVGLNNKRVDYSKLTFESQWMGDYFNSDISNNENYANNSLYTLDLNVGLLFSYFSNSGLEYNIGGSISHINKPQDSFYDLDVRKGQKFIIHSSLKSRLSRYVFIHPGIIYINHSNAEEVVLGANSYYRIADVSLCIGAWYHIGRDFIPVFGLEFQKFLMLISYDLNLSDLNHVSNYKGGTEISIRKTILCSKRRTKYSFKDNGSIPCSGF